MATKAKKKRVRLLLKDEVELQHAIGNFIYWFSQLEFTIRARLAGALELKEGLFNIILGPYDFVTLCNVCEKTLSLEADDASKAKIKKFFSGCKELNDKSRVVIAHGTWTLGGVRHMSRQSLQSAMHFGTPSEIKDQAEKAKRLMKEIITLKVDKK